MDTVRPLNEFTGKIRPDVPYTLYEKALYDSNSKDAVNALRYLQETRQLTLDTLQHFHVGYNEVRDEIVIPIFKDGDLVDYKYRGVREKTFKRWEHAETWCFNDKAFLTCEKDKYIIICEAELDAATVYQFGHESVMSLTGGAQGPTPWVARIPDNLQYIFILMDNDEAGREAAQKIADKLGIERCRNVILPCKDPNEFLTSGGTREEFNALVHASKRFEVKDVYKVADVMKDLENRRLKRSPVFSKRLTAHLNGGVPNQSLVTISGKTGAGKSSLLTNLLVGHADRGEPVLLVSLENDLQFTVQRLLEVKYKKTYNQFTKEDWERIRVEMADYPFYIDTSMETFTLEKMGKMLAQAKKLYGVKFFGFDHIGFLPTRDDHKEISQMVRGLKLLARENDMIVYIVSHVRKLKDAGDIVTADDLKGSSSIAQDSDIVMFVFGTTAGHWINIDKARMSRDHVKVPVNFSGDTGLFVDDYDRGVEHFSETINDPTIDDSQ